MQSPPVAARFDGKKKRRWIWMLLLLAIALLIFFPRPANRGSQTHDTERKKATANQKADPTILQRDPFLDSAIPPTFRRFSEFDASDYESATEYIVTGKVTTESGKKPVPGTVVSLYGDRYSLTVKFAQPLAEGACDSAGKYEIRLPAPFSGSMTARQDGYVPVNCILDLKSPGVIVRNFALKEGRGIIEGRVFELGGKPLANVLVRPVPVPPYIGPYGYIALPDHILSNARGVYRIANMPPGDWNITTNLGGYLTQTKGISMDSGRHERIDFELTPVPTISLAARNSKGKTIFAHAICPHGATTEENGVMTISVPADANPFKCGIRAEGYKSKEISIDPQMPPTEVLLEDPDMLRGRVLTSSRSPVSGASIGLSETTVDAITDDNGDFQILIDGPVPQVFVTKPGFIAEFLYFRDQKCPDFLEVILKPAEGGIYGRVVDEKGDPVTRFSVVLRDAGSDHYPGLFKYIDNDNGMFSITEAPAGSYQMVVHEIIENIDQVPKRMSMQVEIKNGFFLGEVLVILSRFNAGH